MNPSHLISELGAKMGIPSLALNEQGLAKLVFDKTITVNIEYTEREKTLHLYSVLGSIPPENREPLYETLLGANFFGVETGGAAFSIDKDKNEIILDRSLPVDKLDSVEFEKYLHSFVDHVESWTGKLATLTYQNNSPESSSPQSVPNILQTFA